MVVFICTYSHLYVKYKAVFCPRVFRLQCLLILLFIVAEDAELAVQCGADAILVSNHGGRQLDTVLATICYLKQMSYFTTISCMPIILYVL